MKPTFFPVLALTGALVPSLWAAPQSALEVKGDITHSRSWTSAQLSRLAPVQTIRTTLKGKPFVARGIPLWSLLQAATPKLDSKQKHPEARFIVLARGKDGYLASFALPELLPDAGNARVFLVWEANGKPLGAKDGPFRLVVPSDKKPMRWTYNLIALEIYDGKRLSQAPPAPRS